ncbi:MAG: phosphopyruvate hydratase [Candidatus Nomurabacteria bacterium]|jgi:enolase|nr:phosphopyruvate hydratase [Candidatus Nomurabacteria bacterium]
MENYKIKEVLARWILDSRGNPTVEADVYLAGGAFGRAAVPSGASTGSGEALELRDGGVAFGGKGVNFAVENVRNVIAPALINVAATDQKEVDRIMRDLDGTENKSKLGANAILAVSLAVAKAAAIAKRQTYYQHFAELAENSDLKIPMPLMNVENGGAHAGWATDFQEYMIVPKSARTIADAVRMGAEVFHALGKVLKNRDYLTLVGDEGGYGARVRNGNNEPLEMIAEAIGAAGYDLWRDFVLAQDIAASEFRDGDGYKLKTSGEWKSSDDLINWYTALYDQFNVRSVEDGLGEDDWAGWQKLTARLGDKMQLVGDDLLVTNPKLLQKAIDEKACNAILVKPNQIGTLSETIEAVNLAKRHNFRTVMSHRSGETEDVTIAHLAVGLGCDEIKTGSLSRSDRVAKYNELLRIAEFNPAIPFSKPF